MSNEKSKPDLVTVLRRRRRTVTKFLSEAQVNTLEKLNTLLLSLEVVYQITENFTSEAQEYIASLTPKPEQRNFIAGIKGLGPEAKDKVVDDTVAEIPLPLNTNSGNTSKKSKKSPPRAK